MSNSSFPSLLDQLLSKLIQDGGVDVPARQRLNFADPRFLLTDNPSNPVGSSSDVTLIPAVSSAVPIATGTVTLTPAQAANDLVPLSGTLTGAVTLVLPSSRGQSWVVDATAITFAGHAITLQANGNNWGTSLAAAGVWRVSYNGTKLYGETLTP